MPGMIPRLSIGVGSKSTHAEHLALVYHAPLQLYVYFWRLPSCITQESTKTAIK